MEQLGVNAHALRHTFITKLVRNKVDISIIQALSRHSSTNMILRYSKPSKEEIEETVNNII
jgi:integrase/recombinase XerC/integrase/recombinase XerD